MSDKLELRVVFAAVDKFLRPVKAITQGASEASKALKANTDRMKEFNRTIEQIDAFKKVERDAAIAANTFKSTQDKIAALKAEMSKVGVPTKAMTDELGRLSKASEDLRQKHQSLITTEQQLFQKLKAAGVDTRDLAEHRRKLASANAEATNASRQLTAALEAENQKMKRLHAARAEFAKSRALAGKLAGIGAGVSAAGVAVGLPAAKATRDFADFETAMLGVQRQMDGARDANGKVTKTYWEMADAIKAMAEQPHIGKTADEIARIVEGGARMGIQGKQNLLIFADTTAVMSSAFDLPVDQVGDDIGKLSQLYKIPIKDIKSLGDTINWLDDNALAKGGDIIDVMKRIAGTADMVKMNFKEAGALGSTFLSLGANAEVAASAANAMMRELSVANMQGKRFQGGMAMLGMNSKDVQSSMSKDATGTILKVLEKIKALSGDKQLEAATRLFGKEFGDDAAKLASNLDEYRRQLQLVNDERARGSMQREADSRGDTLNARMDAAKNAFTNLSTDLGATLKPALVETLEKTLAIIQGVRDWAKENPNLSSGLMTVAKWLAIGLTAIGALTIAAGAILVQLAAVSFAMSTLGIAAAPVFGIIALIAAIAAGAVMIYANWDKIGPWFAGLFERITNGLINLKDRGLAAGRELINGIIDGISARWEALRAAVTGIADSTIGWVRDKLGIRSPSRVFAEIGKYTMLGLEKGLAGGEDGPLATLAGTARKLAALGAGVAVGAAPMAASAGSLSSGGDTYHITIQAPAGSDAPALAAEVERVLERIQSRKAAAHRSRLRDMD